MGWQIILESQPEKFLKSITQKQSQKILHKLALLSQDPLAANNNISKLEGTTSSYRLRIGDIRAVYFLTSDAKTITVSKLAPRGSSYKP